MVSNLEVIVLDSAWTFFLTLICFARIRITLVLFIKMLLFLEEGVVSGVVCEGHFRVLRHSLERTYLFLLENWLQDLLELYRKDKIDNILHLCRAILDKMRYLLVSFRSQGPSNKTGLVRVETGYQFSWFKLCSQGFTLGPLRNSRVKPRE